MKLTVIIPVYNEYATLLKIVERVREVELDKEIILVDDFSTDGTRNLYPRIEDLVDKIILHEQNQGKGAAIRTGLRHASGDFVVIQDADLEYDPQEYHLLIQPLIDDKADVVYGSRFLGGRAHRVLYFWHMMGNRFLTLLSNMTTNLNLSDMETCFKMFRREVIQSIRIEQDRFGFEPEVTAKIAQKNVRIYEVGISYFGRTYAEGKKINWKDGCQAIWCILKYGLFQRDGASDNHNRNVIPEFPEYARWRYQEMASHVGGGSALILAAGDNELASHFTNRERLTLTDWRDLPLHLLKKQYKDAPHVRVDTLDPNGDIPSTVADRSYDTIVCVDALERADEPEKFLARLRDLLSEDGRLILLAAADPDLTCGIDERLGRRRFDRPALNTAVSDAGLAVERFTRFNPLGAAGYWISGKVLRSRRLGGIQMTIAKIFLGPAKWLNSFDNLKWGNAHLVVTKKK